MPKPNAKLAETHEGMAVEHVRLDDLHPDPANVRLHNARNLAAIKASLARFGQQKPIVVDGDGIVRAGNGTLAAARDLGWETIAVVRTPLRGADAVAYAIADNRTAELAEWDEQALAETLRAIQSEPEIAIEATGYTDDEIDAMCTQLANAIIDNGGLADAMGGLPDGDKLPFQQMTFTVTDAQADTIRDALATAKDAGPFGDTGNENSNGNALARIAEAYRGAS